ncbi:MAG: Ig-like domain-containing protein, partial [Oscillospiraceae bacterium]|nr:Ig-like domain-containing protein [Oscillospiraceae bacterium]
SNAPFEGSIIKLPKNTWDGGWNWQGTQVVSTSDFTKDMPMSEVYDKASTIKVSFKINGATAGTNRDYDTNQIFWQINIKCHKGDDWPWITGGTSTYENGILTVSADLSALLDAKYRTADYLLDSINLIPAAASDSANDTISVYYEDMKVSLEKTVPATDITVSPKTMELNIGEKDTVAATVTPDNTTDTVVFTSDKPDVASVGAASGEVTALAEGTAVITAKANDTVFAECTVIVKKNTYAITVKSNNDAYGTASANVKEAAENDTVELSYTAAKGYKFSKWESEDVTVAKDGTFTMPAKEVTVTAVFEELPPDEYAINITKPVNGKVSVKDGASSAVKNTVIDLVITPDKGYEVDTVKVNGEAITGTSFTMPEKDVTVEVTFKKSTYTVTVAAAANGTVTADKATAQMGDTITVTATPDTDYELSKITVNGTAITGNTFTMPAENVTVTAEFKKIGSAGAEVVVPEGVSVSFAGSKEDILKAVFGDDYAALVEAGYKLDAVMTVKDETAVSAEDKALVEGALSGDMHIGLLIDVSLVMTKDGVSTVVANSSKPVSFVIGVPDSIIADGRTYSVIRVHDGAAEDIGGTYDAANKTITVASDKYSTYAVVYKDAPAPQPEPTVTYYPITADRNVTLTASSAAAGTQINVRVDFGYDAYVYCGGRVIDKITEGGSFTMPAGKVTIVTQANGYLVMIKNAAPNSYIFVYDADMNYIKTNGSVKGIKGEGKVTVKLGEEYAGKTVTLYKGRKSTSVKLDSLTLDENGNATFTVEGGKNYTAVVE